MRWIYVLILSMISMNANGQYEDNFDAVNVPANNELDFGDEAGIDFGDDEGVTYDDPPVGNTGSNSFARPQQVPATVNEVGVSAPSYEDYGVMPLGVESVDSKPVINAQPLIESNDFLGAPMVPGTMRYLAEGEAPEVYVVESGDTLFDICSQLLDEGAYWPKLWSMNPQIKNPHFIWPGMTLVFYPGNKDNPPFLEVAQDQDIVPIDKGGIKEEALMTSANGRVPDLSRGGLGTPPTEFMDEDSAGLGDQLVSVSGIKYTPTHHQIVIPGFFWTEEKPYYGRIVGGVEGELVLGEDRDIGIAINSDLVGAVIGKTYTVLRPHGYFKGAEDGEGVGYYYSTVGNVKLTKVVRDGEMILARMTQNVLNAEPGDVIVDYISTNRKVSLSESIGTVTVSDGRVIGGSWEGSQLGGRMKMVYLNRGTNHGVSNGQYYRIYEVAGKYANSSIREEFNGYKIPVAAVKIVDVTEVASVGYVIESQKVISRGDYMSDDQSL